MAQKTEPVFLRGKSNYLRPLAVRDLERCHRWINDPKTRFSVGKAFLPVTQAGEQKFIEAANDTTHSVRLAIVLNKSHRHIGVCGLESIQWQDRCAEFGILIGEEDCRGKGYGTEATQMMVAYAFETLNLHRLQLGVLDFNKGGIAAYEKAGFVREGVQRKRCYRGGKYYDHLIYGILAEEFFTGSRGGASRRARG